MSKTIVSEEEKNELGKQMVEDLRVIAELEQKPIRYFKVNENGVFCEVQIDYTDHKHSTK
ncbi:hypothetical protein [Acinetobacter sp. Ac_5812]|uniref:hypothetical protein n=1 Tax=Acinetobacter sp. Ac_5812 TaxID=1848937 RepID=UPI00148FA9CE|nr:hypothetical protein [Acinetobacter sp. Ac_5812]NNP67937.1 hypothetical protein [Acinetobacter sp. Ac_5812]